MQQSVHSSNVLVRPPFFDISLSVSLTAQARSVDALAIRNLDSDDESGLISRYRLVLVLE